MANKLFLTGAFALAIGGIVVAFLTIGSPGRAREAALDERRVQDLQSIAARLHERYGETGGTLPPVLTSAVTEDEFGRSVARDPVTQRRYQYRRLSARRYELCATFAAPSERRDDGFPNAASWSHGAGHTCYSRDAD